MNGAKTVLSAVIIAKNEETMLADCLKSVSFCDEVIVVDSGSADRTTAIAEKMGARVYQRAFDDFAAQKNFAVSKAAGRWVLSVDADERVSPELKKEILAVADEEKGSFSAYAMPRINFIFGKRFRGWSDRQDMPVRFFLKDKGFFEGAIHETLRAEGALGRLKNPLFHYSTKDIKDYLKKLDHYTDLEAKTPRKDSAWKALGRFAQAYFFKGGCLSGREGFIFSVLSGYYEFIRYSKSMEEKYLQAK